MGQRRITEERGRTTSIGNEEKRGIEGGENWTGNGWQRWRKSERKGLEGMEKQRSLAKTG